MYEKKPLNDVYIYIYVYIYINIYQENKYSIRIMTLINGTPPYANFGFEMFSKDLTAFELFSGKGGIYSAFSRALIKFHVN